MIERSAELVGEFLVAAERIGLTVIGEIEHEAQPAPHTAHSLRDGKCAVYVFSLSESYGKRVPAGAHRALKVGKAGPNSNNRFQYQHYSGSAGSTLVGSMRKATILWPYLGLEFSGPEQLDGKYWLSTFTDRDNFYLDAANNPEALGALENFLNGRLGPVFEGIA